MKTLFALLALAVVGCATGSITTEPFPVHGYTATSAKGCTSRAQCEAFAIDSCGGPYVLYAETNSSILFRCGSPSSDEDRRAYLR